MHSRVLVTGGAGFIGSLLSKELAAMGYEILAYDSLLRQVHKDQQPPKDLPLIVGDVRDTIFLTEILKDFKPNIIIHLASETGTAQSFIDPKLHTDTNVNGTASLLSSIEDSGISLDYLLLTSSRAVYGEGPYKDRAGQIVYPNGRGLKELTNGIWDFAGLESIEVDSNAHRSNPSNVYGTTKLTQEYLFLNYSTVRQVPLGIFRLQNVYGVGQSLDNPYTGIVNLFVRLANANQEIPVFEDGLIFRDFIFVGDVISILKYAVFERLTGIHDVGTGVKTSIFSLATLISKKLSSQVPNITGDFRLGDVRSAKSIGWNIGHSGHLIDFTDLNQGLESLIPWIQYSLKAKP